MARVELELNGCAYAVACENGAEARLADIAAFVDARMKGLASGKSETQNLVLVSLMLADQIFDLRSELARARTTPAARTKGETAANPTAASVVPPPVDESRYERAIHALAARIDAVVGRLARA